MNKYDERLFRIWKAMKNRCLNKKNNRFSVYGGRGIKICDEWLDDFNSFKKWSLDNGYDDTLTIDRIDVDGNYEPSNCRWATMKEQQNNRSNTIFITYKGETKSVMEWHEITGINHKTLIYRYHKGMSPEEIIESPMDYNEKMLSFNGKEQSISAWARETGIKNCTIQARLYYGWTVEEALTTKTKPVGKTIFLEYDGEKLTLSEWSKKLGLSYNTLFGRRKRGWTNKEILYGKD